MNPKSLIYDLVFMSMSDVLGISNKIMRPQCKEQIHRTNHYFCNILCISKALLFIVFSFLTFFFFFLNIAIIFRNSSVGLCLILFQCSIVEESVFEDADLPFIVLSLYYILCSFWDPPSRKAFIYKQNRICLMTFTEVLKFKI